MIIGIDASRAVRAAKTGTERYSFEIINHLIKGDRKNQYALYAPHPPKEPFPEQANVVWKIIPHRRLWSQVYLANELRKSPPDVLFVPSHVVPLISSVPSVVTVHDLAYRYFPEYYPRIARQYISFSTSVSVSKARRIITPSLSTKKDILKSFRFPENRIDVIPHGYDKALFRPDTKADQPPLHAPYVLFIGRIEQKKNLTLLVDSFSLLAKEKPDIQLVLAGKLGFGYEKIQDKISTLAPSIRQRIIQTGYLPEYDLVRYLKHAKLFSFPSQYEGFGLPVLEAMAIGTPVVCSNTSSLPEVAGAGAVLLPPENPLSWAAAFSRILNQPTYAKEIVTAGLKQASNFSWEKAAEQTLETITNAAKT